MKTLLKAPLAHFVVVAGLIFAIWSAFGFGAGDRAGTIYVSRADVERMAALYSAEAGVLAGPDEIRAMVAEHIENEALAREARRLGLDVGDTIVDRRLAQKMRFMVDDLATPELPGEQDLRDWFAERASDYALPPTISFAHVYLRHANTDQAAQLLGELNSGAREDWQRAGDPFMLQRQYGELPYRETVRLFGDMFADDIFDLEPGTQWHGPVYSALGTHLVRVDAHTSPVLPGFEDARAQVERDWRDQAQRRLNAEGVADIIARYEIEFEGVQQ